MTLKEVQRIIGNTTAEQVNEIVDSNDEHGSFIITSVFNKETNEMYFVNCVFTLKKHYVYFVSTFEGIHYNNGISPKADYHWAKIPISN